MFLPSRNPFKCREEVLYLPNVLTFFPLTGGCSEGLDMSRFFFKYNCCNRLKLSLLLSQTTTIIPVHEVDTVVCVVIVRQYIIISISY